MLVLPISQNGAWFEFACDLEGISYTFTFRFNDRDGCWYFDLSDAAGNALAAGLKTVTSWPLLSALRTLTGLPPGELILSDEAGLSEEASFDSLGRRHLLYYLTAAELGV